MKVSYKLLVPAFLAGLLLAACGQQDTAAPADDAMEAAGEMVEEAGEMVEEAGEMAEDAAEAVGDAVSNEPGGYEPSEEERIPGVTRP